MIEKFNLDKLIFIIYKPWNISRVFLQRKSWKKLIRKMLKALGTYKLIRPIISGVAPLASRLAAPSANVVSREFHATPAKLGGGDHEFVVKHFCMK